MTTPTTPTTPITATTATTIIESEEDTETYFHTIQRTYENLGSIDLFFENNEKSCLNKRQFFFVVLNYKFPTIKSYKDSGTIHS